MPIVRFMAVRVFLNSAVGLSACPAANVWQVSIQTPSRSGSSVSSIIFASCSHFHPILVPCPATFSSSYSGSAIPNQFVNSIDRSSDLSNPQNFAAGRVRPWMNNDVWNTQQFGAPEFNCHRLDAFVTQLALWAGEVNQIRCVRNAMFDLVFFERRFEKRYIVFRNRLGAPLIVIFRKDLNAIARSGAGIFDGLEITAGDRHVSTKDCH